MAKVKAKVALDVLVLAFNPHVGAADARINRMLRDAPSVRRITSNYHSPDCVDETVRERGINTIVFAVHEYFYRGKHEQQLVEQFHKTAEFIEVIRRNHSRIVFVLDFPSKAFRKKFLSSTGRRFKHYLFLLSTSSKADVRDVLEKCNVWHRKQYEYDVALSFAGEDREIVEGIAAYLNENGSRVFYDRYEQADLLGKDLYQHFQKIYRDRARYCLMFASQHYAAKLWTNHELKQTQARVFSEQQDYLLPVRLDDTDIPGLNQTVGYLDARTLATSKIGDVVLQKLFHKSYQSQKRGT